MSADLEALIGSALDGPEVAGFLSGAGMTHALPPTRGRSVFVPDLGFNLTLSLDLDIVDGVTLIFADYSGPFPFGLSASSDRSAVDRALGAPDFTSPHVGSDSVGLQFFKQDTTIWVNVVNGLIRDLAVRKIEENERVIARRLKDPAHYGSPPNAEGAAAVQAVPLTLLDTWSQRDTLAPFQKTYMPRIESAATRFVAAAADASSSGDMAALLDAVRDVVEAVNAVEHESQHELGEPMVETLERDEFGAFIDAVFAATGARAEDADDVTLPWREW